MDNFTSFTAPPPEEQGFFSRLFGRKKSSNPPTPSSPKQEASKTIEPPIRSAPILKSAVIPAQPSQESSLVSKPNPSPKLNRPNASSPPVLPGITRKTDEISNVEESFRMKDESVSVCYECDIPFTVLNRRHHCIACGQIFCGKCTRRTESSGLKLPTKTNKPIVRICDFCFNTLSLTSTSSTSQHYAKTRYGDGHTLVQDSQINNDSSDEEDNDHIAEELLSKTAKRISFRNLSYRDLTKSFDQMEASENENNLPGKQSNRNKNSISSNPSESNLSNHSTQSAQKQADIKGILKSASTNDLTSKNVQNDPKTTFYKQKDENDGDSSNNDDDDDDDDEGYLDLESIYTQEDTYNAWFSKPSSRTTEVENIVDDPLRSDTSNKSTLGSSSSSSKLLNSNKSTTSSVTAPQTPKKSASRTDELKEQYQRRKLHGREFSLSRAHFSLDSKISLPTTPEVKQFRPSSHSLLDASPRGAANDDEIDTQTSIHEMAFKRISISHLEHICDQLMAKFKLESKWKDLMIYFADKAVSNIKMNVRGGDKMDILHYIKLKRIPGGSFHECDYFDGLVFDGNRIHRKMRSSINNPKILLLGCSLEFERRENVFMSIDKVLQQEKEYLKLLCSKVISIQPDIIFVEKNVSLYAQELLLEKGITLLVNVKHQVLQMLSRITGADIMQTTDHVSPSNLGRSPYFNVDTYLGPWGSKSCTRVGGNPQLFGTIILRGAPDSVLQNVKKTMQFLIYSAYNMVLENHLLFEETATTMTDASLLVSPTSPKKSKITSISRNLEELDSRDDDDTLHPLHKEHRHYPAFSLKYDHILLSTSWSVSVPQESCSKAAKVKSGACGFPAVLEKDDSEQQILSTELPQQSQNFGANKSGEQKDSVYNVCPTILLPPLRPELKQTCEIRTDSGAFETLAQNPSLAFSYRSLLVPTGNEVADPEIPELPKIRKNIRLPLSYQSINHLKRKRIAGMKQFAPQHLIYLHSLYCPSTSTQCLPHTPQIIHFYSSNDLTLGQFLENFCFSDKTRCKNEECHRPITEHERCIMHAEGRINIAVRPFDPKSFFERLGATQANPRPTSTSTQSSTVNNNNATNSFNDPLSSSASDSSTSSSTSSYSSFDPSNILMWSNCKNLQRQTPYMIPMSRETWNFSLGKFFELVFYSAHTRCRTCNEPTYRGHVRYFYYNNKVAMFEYESIKSFDVSIPPMQVSVDTECARKIMIQDIDDVVLRAQKLYDTVLTKLVDLEDACTNLDDEEELRSVTQIHRATEEEKLQFLEIVMKERACVESKEGTTLFHVTRLRRLFYLNVRRWSDSIGELESRIHKKWKTYMVAGKEKERQEAKDKEKRTMTLPSGREKLGSDKLSKTSKAGAIEDNDNINKSNGSIARPRSESVGSSNSTTTRERANSLSSSDSSVAPSNPSGQASPMLSGKLDAGRSQLHSSASIIDDKSKPGSEPLPLPISIRRERASSSPQKIENRDLSKTANGNMIKDPKLGVIGAQQESLFMTGENLESLASPAPQIVLQVPILSIHPHALLNSTKIDTINEEHESHTDDESSESDDSPNSSVQKSSLSPNSNHPNSAKLQKSKENSPVASFSPRQVLASSHAPENGLSQSPHVPSILSSSPQVSHPLSGIIQTLGVSPGPPSSMMQNRPETSSRFLEALQLVLPQKKTQILDMMEDVNVYIFSPESPNELCVAVHENEPSSIIAFSLMSDRFKAKMQTFENPPPGFQPNSTSSEARTSNTFSPTILSQPTSPEPIQTNSNHPGTSDAIKSTTTSLNPPSSSNPPSSPSTPIVNLASGAKSISADSSKPVDLSPSMDSAFKGLVSAEMTTIDLEWKTVPIWGGPRIQMQCKTYYATQFAWLRSLVGLDETVFAQSLSRCKPWKARGGKSNSRFARTLDERFILKQVQPIELESFLAFAPLYFDYFSKVYFQQVPTAICKIVGIYSVTLTRKGKSPVKVDLIVQENLFYGQKISKVFDLKGSLRSRYARPESPNDKDVVFMDENLLEMMYGDPICVSNEAKAMLGMTVWNDTLCLSSLNVMDYSLLVGVDETNGRLVLGIIDYMRTYTWDKQLETWVKRSGFLGGGGSSKIPTIISPKQYKKRFRMAIWAYFLLIPDLNTKLIYEFQS